MKSSFLLRGALLAATVTATGAAHAQDLYRTHRNARFGTVVRYPANLVAPQPESANGDGRKFVSRDGQIELTTYAFHNVRGRTARGELNRAVADWKRDGARLTYARNGVSWFVLSGYLGSDIFYEKTLLKNGIFHTLIWQYPKELKKRLDASVASSVASFSVGQGLETAAQPTPRVQLTPRARPEATPRPTIRRRVRSTPRASNSSGY